jgi:hypothetical protein
MKSNFNLPKIATLGANSDYLRNEKCEPLFPRGEHPDQRSDREFLRAIEKKVYITGRRPPNSIVLMCLNNGKEYSSIKAVKEDLGISTVNIQKHLRGYYSHIQGYKFKRLL